MPEATFICLDNSDPTRNGDYFPTRLMASQEAVSLLVGAKMQKNPENAVGFLTLGGKAVTVVESLTSDADRVMASVAKLPLGGACHLFTGLQVASLALSHRQNSRAEKRVVAFIGSPVTETAASMEKLAKRLRKDEVAIDLVAYGCEESLPVLEKFISVVSKNNNSHLVVVPEGRSVCDVVLSSAVIYGSDPIPENAAGGPSAYDPYSALEQTDPELAMVLRMSAEEERRRQAALASGSANAAAAAAPSNPPEAQPAAAAPVPAAEVAPTVAAPAPAPPPTEHRQLTEEEELELAIKMSLEMAAAEQQQGSSANLPVTGPGPSPSASAAATNPPAAPANPATLEVDPAFQEAVQDADFMASLRAATAGNNPGNTSGNNSQNQAGEKSTEAKSGEQKK